MPNVAHVTPMKYSIGTNLHMVAQSLTKSILMRTSSIRSTSSIFSKPSETSSSLSSRDDAATRRPSTSAAAQQSAVAARRPPWAWCDAGAAAARPWPAERGFYRADDGPTHFRCRRRRLPGRGARARSLSHFGNLRALSTA
jgi:hypothetical protein